MRNASQISAIAVFRYDLQAARIETGEDQFLPEVEVVTGNGIQYFDGLSNSSD
jgi:hypothetical protein